MERILLLLASLCPVLSYAQMSSTQTTAPGSLTDEQVFELLDDTEIPTRLLWDKAAKFDDPTLFNGTTLTPENRQNFSRFGLTYASLYGMPLDANNTIANPDDYMNASDAYDAGGALALSVVHYEFQKFKENILDDNLIDVQNNLLVDNSRESNKMKNKNSRNSGNILRLLEFWAVVRQNPSKNISILPDLA